MLRGGRGKANTHLDAPFVRPEAAALRLRGAFSLPPSSRSPVLRACGAEVTSCGAKKFRVIIASTDVMMNINAQAKMDIKGPKRNTRQGINGLALNIHHQHG